MWCGVVWCGVVWCGGVVWCVCMCVGVRREREGWEKRGSRSVFYLLFELACCFVGLDVNCNRGRRRDEAEFVCCRGRATCQNRVLDLELVELLGLAGVQVDFQGIVGLGQWVHRILPVAIQLVGSLIFVDLVCCKTVHRGVQDTQMLLRFGIRDHILEAVPSNLERVQLVVASVQISFQSIAALDQRILRTLLAATHLIGR